MLTDLEDLLGAAARVYSAAEKPKPFALLEAVRRITSGEDPAEIAREIRSTRKKVLEVTNAHDPIRAVFKLSLADASAPEAISRARRGVGQMPGRDH